MIEVRGAETPRDDQSSPASTASCTSSATESASSFRSCPLAEAQSTRGRVHVEPGPENRPGRSPGGMPLNLLQRQLGHKDIQQTMQYAEFQPQYGDVGTYMDSVGRDVFGQESVDSVPEPVPVATRKEDDLA